MTGSGTALDPYIIWDVNDLQDMALALTDYYELGQDIDASATTGWNWNAGRGVFEGFVPVGTFNGSLHGRGYRISGLYMDRYAAAGGLVAGLFSSLGGTVQHLFLSAVDITAYAQGNISCFVGALAGQMVLGPGGALATIYRSYVESGNVEGSLNDPGLPHDSLAVGGLVGWIYDANVLIDQCASYANATAHGIGQATVWCGGLIGLFRGTIAPRTMTIRNSFARGNSWAEYGAYSICHSGGLIGAYYPDLARLYCQNCYSTGAVYSERADYAGGLIGRAYGLGAVGVTNCFWDTQTSGQVISAGGTGRTTAQMKTGSTFTGAGWDFVWIWDIDSIYGAYNDGYPFHRWYPMPFITVVIPNGGEVWLQGATYTILWQHYKDVGANVRIELLKGGVLDEVISASTPVGPVGGGNYDWTIDPGKAPDVDYQVRITSTTLVYTDSSDDNFRIKAPSVPSPIASVATLPATGVG